LPTFNPKNWTQQNEVLTMALMNTQLRDQLLALKQKAHVIQTPNTGTDWQTSSTSYVDVGSEFNLGTFAPNIQSGTTTIIISFNGQVAPSNTTTSRQVNFDVTIDGNSISGGFGVVGHSGTNGHIHNISFVRLVAGITPGTKSIKLRWKVSGDTATLYAGASSGNRPRPQMAIQEIG
jgi:hypothetical protein